MSWGITQPFDEIPKVEANNGAFFTIFSNKKEGSGGEERTRLKSLGEQFHSDEEDGGGGGEADDRQPLTASRDTAVVVAANTSVNAQGASWARRWVV